MCHWGWQRGLAVWRLRAAVPVLLVEEVHLKTERQRKSVDFLETMFSDLVSDDAPTQVHQRKRFG